MAYTAQSFGRNRANPSALLPIGSVNRASSYSTCMSPWSNNRNVSNLMQASHQRPSSTFDFHSRQPSYYASYPVATPSSTSHDASPPMPPSNASDSPLFPSSSTGANTPAKKVSITPIDITAAALRRDGSSSSGEHVTMTRHKTSVDRLRSQGVERAPSPSSVQFATPVPSEAGGSSRANSPHPSSLGYSSRQPGLSPGREGYPRPQSMTSMKSSINLGAPPGGARHHGRPVQLEMPRLLGARPDQNAEASGVTPGRTRGSI